MAKTFRLFAALVVAFGTFPTHLAIATSVAPIPEAADLSDLESTEIFDGPPVTGVDAQSDAPPADTANETSTRSGDDSEQPVATSVLPPLYIKAVNPGYTVNGASNTNEFIELANSTDTMISLSGFSLWYNNGKNDYLIFEFPEFSFLKPGSLLLRLQSSPEVKAETDYLQVAHIVYAKTLATSGKLSLRYTSDGDQASSDQTTSSQGQDSPEDSTTSGETDRLCWLGGDDCLPAFQTSSPTAIVRDEQTGEFSHLSDYYPLYVPENYQIILPAEESQSPDSDGADVVTEPQASDVTTDDSATPESQTPDEPSDEPDASASPSLPETAGITDDQSSDSTSATSPTNQTIKSCQSAVFTEVLTYYVESASEQFIELFNPTDEPIPLSDCQFRYKNKLYDLPSEATIPAQGYYIYHPSDFALTKNPSSQNLLDLVFNTTETIATLTIPHGQKKGVSYSYFSPAHPDFANLSAEDYDLGYKNGIWLRSYRLTPGAENIYQKFQTCPAGKVINEETGNCVLAEADTPAIKTCNAGYYLNPATNRCNKIVEAAPVKTCAEGYYLNPATNRCNKLPTEASSTLTPCKEGYERNPETNRCRKIASSDDEDELTPCAEGYERNPETNRCRKIKVNNGADYALTPITGTVEQKSFLGLWAILALAALGAGCLVFQFRLELKIAFGKLKQIICRRGK